MRILITGGNGYLGRHFINLLEENNYNYLSLIRENKLIKTKKNIRIIDLLKKEQLESVIRNFRPNVVVHIAGFIPKKNLSEYSEKSWLNNVLLTKSIIDALSIFNDIHLIYASTISIYTGLNSKSKKYFLENDLPNPEGFYGYHKLIGEYLCKEWAEQNSQRKCSILRFAGMHGGGRKNGLVFNFIFNSLNNKNLLVNSPKSRYSLLYVKDAAKSILNTITNFNNYSSMVFNIAGEEIVTTNELAYIIKKKCNSKSLIDAYQEESKMRILSIEKAKEIIKFKPEKLSNWLDKDISQYFS